MDVTNNNKISLMSTMLIYATVVSVPGTRYSFKATALAGQAAWLSPVASLIVFIPLIYVLCRVMKAFEGQSLFQIMCRVFGRIVGKTIAVVLTLWLFVLLSMLLRDGANTVILTTYAGMDIRLFLFIAVTLTAIMLRSGLPTFSRMAAIVFSIGVLQYVIILAFVFVGFDVRNVTPISTQDVLPVLGSSVYPLTSAVGITLLFVFNDQIRFGERYAGKFVFAAAFATVASTSALLAVLGMFGADIVNKLRFPFPIAVANIPVYGGETVVASLLILIWTTQEFVLTTFLAYVTVRLLREIFGLNREVPLLTALMGLAFIFSNYISADLFELDMFSTQIEPWFTLSLCLGIPLALFITAKARKMLSPVQKTKTQ